MPFPQFDRSRLIIEPLSERVNDFNIAEQLDPDGQFEPFEHPAISILADKILSAREKNAPVVLMFGGHLIKTGCSRILVRLLERGYVTHLAMNGACSIHDFELAMIGASTESVAKYISEGRFGLWKETGTMHEAISEGLERGMGCGEAIGARIEEAEFPYRDRSVLATAFRLKIPATVHIGIGSDIIHEHPNCNGAEIGEASYRDFLILAQTISHLENGVFLNFGSAVTGPEVYLKCLAMARNIAHQEGKKIVNFTTAVFDLLPLEGENIHETPPKTDPRYYFRPWKTILARTVADGGESHYIQGEHNLTLPGLLRILEEKRP